MARHASKNVRLRSAPGKIDVRVTYLHMQKPPASRPLEPPREGLSIMRARQPPAPFYRYLYISVGHPWLWASRCKLTDSQLQAILQDEKTCINVLYADGVPAGFSELDFRGFPDVELVFFGLVPAYIGQRLGPYLLSHTLQAAWARTPKPERLWLHTCTLDHPRAVETYRRAGFVPYAEEARRIDDPRAVGLL